MIRVSSLIVCGVICLFYYLIKIIVCCDVKFVMINRFLLNNSIVCFWFLCVIIDSFILFLLSRRVLLLFIFCLDEVECSWIFDDLEVLGDIGGVVDIIFLFFVLLIKGCIFDLFCFCWLFYGKIIGSLLGNIIIILWGFNCLFWKKNFVICNLF